MDKSVKVEIAKRGGNCEIITLAFTLDLTAGGGGWKERSRSVANGNSRFTQLHNTAAAQPKGAKAEQESWLQTVRGMGGGR